MVTETWMLMVEKGIRVSSKCKLLLLFTPDLLLPSYSCFRC